MSSTTPNLALVKWDSNADTFDHTQLASNWDKIDADYTRTRPTNQAEVRTTVPSSSNFEGRLVFLSAADSGFAAGTLIKYHGSSFQPVNGVEVLGAVPVSSVFTGRLVLLSAASGSFAQWSLIKYDGTAWSLVNNTYEILSAVPVTNNFAGRLVMLSTANGGFLAWDLIRYNGSTWARVGPDPVYPGTELAYYSQATDITTTNVASPGDTITTFGAATFENVKYYCHIAIPKVTLSVAGNVNFLLQEATVTVGSIMQKPFYTGGNYGEVNIWMPFTPTAASHTYNVKWYISTAGTATLNSTGLAPATFRIVKA